MATKVATANKAIRTAVLVQIRQLDAAGQIDAIEALADLAHSLIGDAIEVLQNDADRKCVS
jgi:hypothetical protein